MTGVGGTQLRKNPKLAGEILQLGTFWPVEVREPQERLARSPTQKNTQQGGQSCIVSALQYKYLVRQHSGDEAAQDEGGGGGGGGGGSESDNDYISQDDRQRILETERLLTESEGLAGELVPGAAGAVRRLPGHHHSRRRRKLPQIPKDKKRNCQSHTVRLVRVVDSFLFQL